MNPASGRRFAGRSSQRGAVLLVSLLILLVLTIIGINGMSVSTLEETMAGNFRDRNLAFQAAEAALRKGEEKARKTDQDDLSDDYGDGTSNNGKKGYYKKDAVFDYLIANWEGTNDTRSHGFDGVERAPRYAIQHLGLVSTAGSTSRRGSVVGIAYQAPTSIEAYRVTARGTGGRNSTVVILESTYTAELDD